MDIFDHMATLHYCLLNATFSNVFFSFYLLCMWYHIICDKRYNASVVYVFENKVETNKYRHLKAEHPAYSLGHRPSNENMIQFPCNAISLIRVIIGMLLSII